jgi:hypothetical protein
VPVEKRNEEGARRVKTCIEKRDATVPGLMHGLKRGGGGPPPPCDDFKSAETRVGGGRRRKVEGEGGRSLGARCQHVHAHSVRRVVSHSSAPRGAFVCHLHPGRNFATRSLNCCALPVYLGGHVTPPCKAAAPHTPTALLLFCVACCHGVQSAVDAVLHVKRDLAVRSTYETKCAFSECKCGEPVAV